MSKDCFFVKVSYMQGENYVIDEGVIVISTPGHSGPDISLIVHNTINGTVLLAGKVICLCLICTCTCRSISQACGSTALC